jgi:integrase
MQVAAKRPATEVFEDSPSRHTREQYPKTLKKFFEYLQLPGSNVDEKAQAFLDKARQTPGWANDSIRQYILENRKRVDSEQITAGTLKGLFTPIKMFCDVYDDITASVNWKRIRKTMPTPQQYADDRAPTSEEIKKLLDYPDRRIKPIVMIMVSSGMRVGGFEGLRWKHIRPITDEKKTDEVLAAHLHVAKNKGGRAYNTFITPECYHEIKKYMDWRKMWGEEITPESYVIRDDFKTADTKRNSPPENGGGLVRRAATPKQLTVPAINRLIVKALYTQGLRDTLQAGQKRHDVRTCHGYRNYFFSTATREGVHGLTLEMYMGHKLPESIPSYMKPTPEHYRDAYLQVVPHLTIYQNVQTLKQQQDVLQEKQEQKDKELEEMKAQISILTHNMFNLMKEHVANERAKPVDLILYDKTNPEHDRDYLLHAAKSANKKGKGSVTIEDAQLWQETDEEAAKVEEAGAEGGEEQEQ